MKADEMWAQYVKENGTQAEYEAWAFGCASDELADLVLRGIKTATASAYALYEIENEALPKEGEYSVILDSRDEAVCIIRNVKVRVVPYCEVDDEQAYKEGEGDRSLAYWREVHEPFFRECLIEAGMKFEPSMLVVCEEFELVYA